MTIKKKPRSYSLPDDVAEAVRKTALQESMDNGVRVSESSVVERILRKKLISKKTKK